MDYPDHLYYTEEHEWAEFDEDTQIATIGITNYAQSELGDIVFLEFPTVGAQVSTGDTLGTIEAVKTVADVYAPVSGEIVEINSALEDSPELVNDEPYENGWLVKIKLSDSSELKKLMSADDYRDLVD